MATYILGRNAKAYYSATALTGSNTATVLSGATEVTNIMDLSLEIDSDFVDATTRAEAANGFASEVAVLKGGRVTFDARWDPTDTVFDALLDAWENDTEFTFIAMDQDSGTSGAMGLAANWSVSFSKSENLRDIQKASVTLTISTFPEWYEVP